jgi:hypothetical protein
MRALVQAAENEPLSFAVSMYCGSMLVSGYVAPSAWWYDVTKSGSRAELWHSLRKVRKEHERSAQLEQLYAPIADELGRALPHEGSTVDEVTLVDVTVLPAIGTQGTQSDGHTLPVARIPFSAIDVWWIVSGDTLRGSGSSGGGWGFLFPIGN